MRIVKLGFLALLVASLFSVLSYAAAPDRIAGAVDSTNTVELKGHVSPMARPEFDQGPVEPSRDMHVMMLFMPTATQQRAIDKLLADLQDRKSANFHKWLAPQQWGERFGLGKGDIDKISAWLEGQGFKITYVANGRSYLSFDGNAAQIQSAFQTEIHYYNVDGKLHFANATPPRIPAALSGIVGGFRGLHNFFPQPMFKKPAYTLSFNGGLYHFLAPGDLATIYDITPLYNQSPVIDGTGQKVVIAGQTDVYLADLHNFRTAFGISDISGCSTSGSGVIQAGTCSSGNFQMVLPTGSPDPGLSPGDLGESDLDIEWVGSVARKAQIIFVTSGNGVDDSVDYAIDKNLAPVISLSYGACEALNTAPSIAAAEIIYKQAAGAGISFFAATGDAGAATCDGNLGGSPPAQLGLSVNYPASSPEVTAVGGTEFNEGSASYWNTSNNVSGDGGSAKSYIPEIAWNDSTPAGAFDGTGGGPSNCAFGTGVTAVAGYNFELCNTPPNGGFPKPTWQTGITPADGVRDIPDIAFSASNFNDVYIVCVPESELFDTTVSTSTCATSITDALTSFPYPSAFGGTSASTPVAAGMTVLLNQYLGAAGTLGTINKELYSIYSTTPTVFHDVVAGTNTATGGTSTNIVPCTNGQPTFEPAALRCTGSTMGYSAGTGYDLVSGLGSVDIDALAKAWGATLSGFTLSATTLASVSAGNNTTSTITVAPVNGFTGTVSFSCTGLPAGANCSAPSVTGGSGTTTLTITTAVSTATGTSTVTVTGTSGAATSTTTVSLVVTATTQSFSLTPQNSTYAVPQGQNVTATVTLTASNGFNTALTYTCTDPASESSCTGPTQATNATSVSFLITTTAATTRLQRPLDRGTRIFYAALLPGLLGIVFTFGSRRRSLRGMRMLGLIMVLGFSTLWLGSCGGNNSSSGNPGTPKQSYTITVNATTGGTNPVTGTTTFTLNVQ
ncbi:MAG: protease pro-enzyme activation domain-containing protein [Candidatus Sulfotelmatobacter sp.]